MGFIRMMVLSSVMVFMISAAGFGMTLPYIGFPFKAFVYNVIGIGHSQESSITVSKETPFIYDFTYAGKKYDAKLFYYGAIYLNREGQNPVWISFNIDDYKLNGNAFASYYLH